MSKSINHDQLHGHETNMAAAWWQAHPITSHSSSPNSLGRLPFAPNLSAEFTPLLCSVSYYRLSHIAMPRRRLVHNHDVEGVLFVLTMPARRLRVFFATDYKAQRDHPTKSNIFRRAVQ